MNHAVLAVAWWFLAMPIQSHWSGTIGSHDDPAVVAPIAVGPFPTEQMCVSAENLAEPSNRTFWTPAQTKQWNDQTEAHKKTFALYDDYMARLAKANPKMGWYKFYPDGPEFWIEREGMRGGTTCGQTCIAFDQHGVGVDIGRGGGSWYLTGKNIPVVTPEPDLPSDQYKITQPCQPVKGWYEVKP